MMSLPKRRRILLWGREEISCCSCQDLDSVHAHCPCDSCWGKAVSRATEYRHWKATREYLQLMGQGTEPVELSSNVEQDVEQETERQDVEQSAGLGRVVEQNDEERDVEAEQGVLDLEQAAEQLQDVEANGDEQLQETEELDHNDDLLQRVKMDVTNAVLKAFQLAEEMDASQQNFMHILQYGKEQYCKGTTGARFEYLWPQSWQTAIKMLENQGYQDAEDYFICLSNSHPCSYGIFKCLKSTCRFCSSPSSLCIKYSYLPLKHKIRQWCSSASFCQKMTAHWREKDHWLNSTGEHSIKKELWDGSRFAELSWFWDPHSEWTLPVSCPLCKVITSAATVNEAASQQSSDHIQLTCSECHTRFDYEVCKATGDPRNIALIGHWDGWQPFSMTCKHSSGAIEVSIATMLKQDRSRSGEVYVCGFVPSHLLPNKRPNSLDPFLHPLIEEVKDLFINGISVYYAAEIMGIPPGNTLLRCLILLWTGDYPAQSEVGKFVCSGIRPCRRCTLEGERNPSASNYYYGNFRYHFRHAWPARELESSLPIMREVDEEDRPSVRANKSKQTGFTGVSILHQLNPLYGFNIIRDLVFDAMHNIPLNVASHHLHYYFNEGILSRQDVDKNLKKIPWTAELKSGRVPEGVTQRLGHWKAEDLQKFIFPASEYVLEGLLPNEHYLAWVTLVRITELVYNTGRNGFNKDDIEVLKRLTARHNILTEEIEGLKSCVVTLHNLIHLSEDIKHFGPPDNYWCYSFERAVKSYTRRSSNAKNLEHTFARAECRRQHLKFNCENEESTSHNTFIENTHFAHASSLAAAQKLSEANPGLREIAVGGKHYYALPEDEMAAAYRLLGKQPPAFVGNTGGYFVRSLYIPHHGYNGVLYRTNEHVYIDDISSGDTVVIKISNIFSFLIDEEAYHVFVSGFKCFQLDMHLQSGNPIVRETVEIVTCKGQEIMRKVMLYPNEDTSSFIVIDYERPMFLLLPQDVLVPQHPEPGDMVAVSGDNGETWLAHVQRTNSVSKWCQVYFYVPDRENNKLYHKECHRLENVDWNSVLYLTSGTWQGECQYLLYNSIG